MDWSNCYDLYFCFISYAKFPVANPSSVVIGLVKIIFTDATYVEIQQYPKVIFAKPDDTYNLLSDYMENEGFKENEEKRSGLRLMFENGTGEQYVQVSVNKYFSKWIWR